MKKTTASLIVASLFFAAPAQQKKITLVNPSTLQREEEVIEITWDKIISVYPKLDRSNFKVINAVSKKEYPYQLEHRGSTQVQSLLVQLTIPAKSTVQLELLKGKPMPVVAKTYCRYVPERKDDFAWENDKIAHRTYGRELEKTPSQMAYGIDVWVKRTDKLVLNERYKQVGDYHTDMGDGLDYYNVGHSLGAGAIAPYIQDSIWFPRNYRDWKVLDNGPLRSTFQLFFDEWTAGGTKMKMVKTISISAGSQMTKNEVSLEPTGKDSVPVVVGIIKRKDPGELLLDEKGGTLAY